GAFGKGNQGLFRALAVRHQIAARLRADVLKGVKHDVGALEYDAQFRRLLAGVERTMHKNGASRPPVNLHFANRRGWPTHVSDPHPGDSRWDDGRARVRHLSAASR